MNPSSTALLGGTVLLLLSACESVPDAPPAVAEMAALESGDALVAPEAPQPAVTPGKITQIGIEDLFVRMGENSVFLVDVRPGFFHAIGSIDGSISMPLRSYEKSFPAKRPELDAAVAAGKLIVLYCENPKCPDAGITAKRLSDLGYRVCIYKGGWDEWKSAGLG